MTQARTSQTVDHRHDKKFTPTFQHFFTWSGLTSIAERSNFGWSEVTVKRYLQEQFVQQSGAFGFLNPSLCSRYLDLKEVILLGVEFEFNTIELIKKIN